MKRSDIPVVCVIYAIAIAFLIMTLQLPEAAQVYPMVLIKDDNQLGELIKAQDVFAREVISKLY